MQTVGDAVEILLNIIFLSTPIFSPPKSYIWQALTPVFSVLCFAMVCPLQCLMSYCQCLISILWGPFFTSQVLPQTVSQFQEHLHVKLQISVKKPETKTGKLTLTSPRESNPSSWLSSSNMVLWISRSPPLLDSYLKQQITMWVNVKKTLTKTAEASPVMIFTRPKCISAHN